MHRRICRDQTPLSPEDGETGTHPTSVSMYFLTESKLGVDINSESSRNFPSSDESIRHRTEPTYYASPINRNTYSESADIRKDDNYAASYMYLFMVISSVVRVHSCLL